MEKPWGNVTGIRPVKIVRRALESGVAKETVFEDFTHRLGVSREKTELRSEERR